MKNGWKYARGVFLIFCLIVIAAYVYHQPSWGMMDDWAHLDLTEKIWTAQDPLAALSTYFSAEFEEQKIRPLHCLMTLFVYKFFVHSPTVVYILNFCFGMALLPLWGKIFEMMFCKGEKEKADHIYIYPLSFFAFLPFWNNFMYISLQEKLIFYFSTLSIYFLGRLIQKNEGRYTWYTLFFSVLCLLSKPTGIFLIVTLMVFSMAMLLFDRRKGKNFEMMGAVCFVILIAYYLVIKVALFSTSYSSRYGDNLNIAGIIQNLSAASIFIPALLLVSVIAFIVFFVLFRKKRVELFALFLPIGFIIYIFILLPWGIINYLLGPAAPFLLGMCFPLYLAIKRFLSKRRLEVLAPVTVCLLAFFILGQVIYVRIVKMADIHRTIEKIMELNLQNQAKFYFPPPYVETHFSLEQFTHARIQYLKDGILNAEYMDSGDNYFLSFDQSPRIVLRGVEFKDLVYQNRTWRIYKLSPSYRAETTAYEIFPKTFLEKLVEKTR